MLDKLTPDWVQAAIAVLGAVGTLFSALGVFLWRLAGRVHEMTAAQATLLAGQGLTTAELAKVRAVIAQGARKQTEALDALTRTVAQLDRNLALLGANLGEREKDIARLEGQMEQIGVLITKQIAAVHGTMASVQRLWETLERTNPGATVRFSDKAAKVSG